MSKEKIESLLKYELERQKPRKHNIKLLNKLLGEIK